MSQSESWIQIFSSAVSRFPSPSNCGLLVRPFWYWNRNFDKGICGVDPVGLFSISLLSGIPLYPLSTIFVYLYTYSRYWLLLQQQYVISLQGFTLQLVFNNSSENYTSILIWWITWFVHSQILTAHAISGRLFMTFNWCMKSRDFNQNLDNTTCRIDRKPPWNPETGSHPWNSWIGQRTVESYDNWTLVWISVDEVLGRFIRRWACRNLANHPQSSFRYVIHVSKLGFYFKSWSCSWLTLPRPGIWSLQFGLGCWRFPNLCVIIFYFPTMVVLLPWGF